ncbi:Hypothetical protein D9617_21g096940 [Elsinoe fawcettii]|nr:Hypothetical protein D9617_21g096940 [Elsinoe fawcettii]
MAAIVVKGVRPTKKAETPPPFYITHTTSSMPSYCYTCGRLVGSRKIKNAKSAGTQSKYCSDKCKAHKPSASPTSLDRVIEDALFHLLHDKAIPEVVASLPANVRETYHHAAPEEGKVKEVEDTRKRSSRKGDHRVLVPCSLVETVVFGRESNVSRAQGRRRRAKDAKADVTETKVEEDGYDEEKLLATLGRLRVAREKEAASESEDESSDDDADDGVPLDAAPSGVTQEQLDEKRIEGQKKAEQRERVRNACRRAVIFGLREPVGENGSDDAEVKTHKKMASTDSAGKDMDDWTSEEDTRKGKKGKKGKGAHTKGTSGAAGDERSSGFATIDGERRKLCEAMMRGDIVEPSFAKGEWG